MTLVLKADKVVSGSPNEAAVESGQIIIGRLPSNHIVIPGDRIEAIHAMVEFDHSSGEARLLDMASEEGVYLNGQKVEVVKVLKAGDVIRIADVTISVREVDSKSYHESVAMASQADAIDGAGGIEDAWSPAQVQNQGLQYQAEAEGNDLPLDDEVSDEDAEEVAKSDSRTREFKTQLRSTKRAQGSAAANGSSSASAGHAGRKVAGGSASGSSGSRGGEQSLPKENLFAPGKERPGGSTLEVVAFWENAILDIKHYGGRIKPGEEPRPNDVYIGNEEDGHLIGIGPKANTKNYLLGKVEGPKAKVYLNGDMKAKVRRSNRVEKVTGPAKFEINYKEMALVKHGPLHYYLKNVSLPAPILRSFQDADGKPIIFVYAILLYALLVGGIMVMPPPADKDIYDEEIWAQVLTIRTPTPKPELQKLPPPKPVVEVAKPVSTPPPPPPKPTPAPIVAEKKPTAQEKVPVPSAPPAPPKTVSLETPQKPQPPAPKPQVVQPNPNNATKGRVKDSTDKSLGPTNAAKATGDSGSKAAGTKGAFASKRQGDTATDQMGVEGGKKNIMSGINLSKLGSGIGAVSDVGGIGAIATGLKSQAGGAGAGSGSAARSSGFGGLGAGSSLNTGGVGQALEGLGGGAGGAGKGGLGDPNGRGGAAGKRIEAQAVVVPQGDPAIEGALTKEEIDAVIKQNLAQIKACYERNLQGDRGLAGRVKVAFLIKSSGRVQDANIVSSDLGNKATESCITGVIRRWKFPLPRGGGVVNVNYPFVFAPR